MTSVTRRDGESFDRMLERFRRDILRSGLLREVRGRRWALSPGERRRAKSARAAYRRARTANHLRAVTERSTS